MEDPQAKIKQLSENLQAQQAKTAKKKEEIETNTKNYATLEREVLVMRQQQMEMEAGRGFRKEGLAAKKEDLKAKIEHAKKVLNSDKGVLQVEKDALQARTDKFVEENKKLHAEKTTLIKENKGTYKEEKKEEEPQRNDENETLETLVKDINVTKDETTGVLSVEAVTRIVDSCVILAGRKFRDSVKENRKKVRKEKNIDLKTYLEQSQKEVSQHTEFYNDTEKQVLNAVGVEKTVLDKSIEYYMSTNNMDIMALMNLLGEKLKSYLKATNAPDVEKFKEVLKFKLDFIEKEGEAIFGEDSRRKVVQSQLASVAGSFQQKEMMSLNMLKSFFEFKLSHAIFEKFGVEDEDIREAAGKPEVQYDMEVAELAIKSEEALYKKFPQLPGMAGQQGF